MSETGLPASPQPQHLSLADSIFEYAREGIMVVDAGGFIVDVNPAFERFTGYAKHEVIGMTPKLLSSGRHDAAFYAGMWTALATAGEWRGEIINRRKSGELYVQLAHIRSIKGADGILSHYIATFLDMQSLDIPVEDIDRLINRDCLTGLPNVHAFAALVGQALKQVGQHGEHGRQLAICVLEFPEFLDLKTMFGMTAIDEVALEVMRRLRHALGADDILAREPSGRFWLSCQVPGGAAFEDRLGVLLAGVTAPIEVQHLPIGLSARVGVAFAGQADIPVQTCLDAALNSLAPWLDKLTPTS